MLTLHSADAAPNSRLFVNPVINFPCHRLAFNSGIGVHEPLGVHSIQSCPRYRLRESSVWSVLCPHQDGNVSYQSARMLVAQQRPIKMFVIEAVRHIHGSWLSLFGAVLLAMTRVKVPRSDTALWRRFDSWHDVPRAASNVRNCGRLGAF